MSTQRTADQSGSSRSAMSSATPTTERPVAPSPVRLSTSARDAGGRLEQGLEAGRGGAVAAGGGQCAPDLPRDLPLADDHRVEPAGDGEQVGGGVGAGPDPQVRVDLRRGVARAAGDGLGGRGAGRRGVRGVVDLQVQLEPVARRQDDGTGHEPVGRRAHELGRDGVDVRRETFQHIEVEVVVTGGEGQQHHVPELIISTFVRHNRRREPSFLAPPRRRPHDEFFAGPCIFRRGARRDGRCGSCGRPAGRCPSTARRASGTAMLDACLDPALASEITLQPVRRHDVDAAIFFSDIVVPLKLAGVDVEIKPGVGPVMGSAVRTADDVARLRDLGPLTPEALQPVSDGVALTVDALGGTPADRLRRRPLHARRVPGRGRPVARPPGRPHPHARRPGHVGGADASGPPTSPARSCARRCWPAPARRSCSTRGRARWAWPTTPRTSPRRRPGR